MFFSIATQPDYRFWNRVQHRGLWINFDSGWQVSNATVSKGYATNSCELRLLETGIEISHSEPRSFPMWFEHGFITNLYPDSGKRAWASDRLHMDLDGRIIWTPIELDLAVPDQGLSIQQARQQIRVLLDQAVRDLGDQSVKLYCSGGLDTFLIYSMLRYHRKRFELLDANCFENDSFIRHNQDALQHYWSYLPQQLHHWTKCL